MSVTEGRAAAAAEDNARALVARVDDGREAVAVDSWKKLAPDAKDVVADSAF